MRTNFDFTPYRRSTVGFDRLFDLLETEPRGDVAEGYPPFDIVKDGRSEEHTSELQSLMRISYAVFCLKKKKQQYTVKNQHIVALVNKIISWNQTSKIKRERSQPNDLQ